MLHCFEVGNVHPMLPLQDHKRSDHLRDQGQPKNRKCPVRTVPLNAIVKPSFDPNYLHLSQLQKVRSHAFIYDLVHIVPTELIYPFSSNFRTPPTSLIKATGFAIIPVARCNVYAQDIAGFNHRIKQQTPLKVPSFIYTHVIQYHVTLYIVYTL